MIVEKRRTGVREMVQVQTIDLRAARRRAARDEEATSRAEEVGRINVVFDSHSL